MSDDNQACEVPLVEQLRDIPKDYRTCRAIQRSDDGRETGHQFIPVGFMFHRAADELERLAGQLRDCERRVLDMQWDYQRGKEDAERKAAHPEAVSPEPVAWRFKPTLKARQWCYSTEKPRFVAEDEIVEPLYRSLPQSEEPNGR